MEKFSWIFWLLIMKNKKIKRTALLLAFTPVFQKFSCATNYSRPASGVGGRREAVSGRGGRDRGAAASDTCCRLIRIIWMTRWRYTSRPKTNLRVKVVYSNVTKKKLLLSRKSIYLCLGIHKYNYVRSEKKPSRLIWPSRVIRALRKCHSVVRA